MLKELPYKAWMDGLNEERFENRKRVYRYNNLSPEKGEERDRLLREMIGKSGKGIYIEPPFHCDYGSNIEVGDNFYANCNSVILDVARVVIGSGSVVTKDIPDNAIAVGNPCRVVRFITDEDRKYYFKNREFDVDDYNDGVQDVENLK